MSKPAELLTDAIATGQVLSIRLPMLAMGMVSPSKGSQREQIRMVTEKMEALALGTIAVQQYWLSAAFRIWATGLSSTDMEKAFDAAYAPMRKTVRANAKRLSRT
ncbi:hypothetical protein [Parvularcula sp. LCG005]|uniref:hypothetical protein n=1 Tax=Parvularcula sp. LCG005 TaxID=3078805 RepID=UPI002941F647|nr:hypothetical protein [Parvularcula sp. LCG005]WOI52850.1 hypothetical protein RUI03_11905 [Parvularcula sp. LCG005]